MRPATAIGAGLVAAVAGAALVACIDLFHTTSDLLTACELDAAAPGCRAEGGVEAGVAGTDFCAWSAEEARANARHACAWLGACQNPLDQNAFGACMFHAMLAYDCGANPAHPVLGKTHALWDCLWQAQSCVAVTACVFPEGTENCNRAGTACALRDGSAPNNTDVRVTCADGGVAKGENCALWGQTCAVYTGVGGVCGGTNDPGQCQTSCENGTLLHVCVGTGASVVDVGIDCASNGAGQCVPEGTWGACAPAGDAGPCAPSLQATCNGDGVASSCPTGNVERINCVELMENPQACNDVAALDPSYDWTAPCAVLADGGAGDAAPCVADSCGDGGQLFGCYRGATFPLDCADAGLGACQLTATGPPQAACAPPP
jgi:hypothetical protein